MLLIEGVGELRIPVVKSTRTELVTVRLERVAEGEAERVGLVFENGFEGKMFGIGPLENLVVVHVVPHGVFDELDLLLLLSTDKPGGGFVEHSVLHIIIPEGEINPFKFKIIWKRRCKKPLPRNHHTTKCTNSGR